MDQLVKTLTDRLPAGTNVCLVGPSLLNDCAPPIVSPLSAAGANVLGLLACNQAELGTRFSRQFKCGK